MPRAAAIYCRLSYAPDGSLEKVERQEDDCRQLADRLAWPIDERHVYHDNSRSAWQRNRKRPGWAKLLEAIERGDVDGVLVYHGDRLIRQPWDLETLLRLSDDRRIALASPSGVKDLTNEEHRFILRIEAAQACRQSADTSRRVKRGVKAKTERGEAWSGGKRPFGWGVPTDRTGKTGKTVYDTNKANPEEFPILRQAVEKLMAGRSKNGVIRWLNSVSTTTEGNQWRSVNLTKLIMSPRIAGLIEREGQLHQAVWPAVVTVEEWEDLKAILRGNRTGEHGRGERKHLLSLVAECYACGVGVITKPSGGKGRKTARLYYCDNSDCDQWVSRNQAHLDEYVTGRVLRRLQDPDLLSLVLGPDSSVATEIVTLERRKAETKEKLRNLADLPGLDAADVAAALASFDKKISELRNRHAATARQRLLVRMAGITRAQWDATPIDVRAETVRALYRVIILPVTRRGPGFDPASVDLVPLELSPEEA
ncbi:recombinase family protein [Nonomuraea angiospora]|uniref:recombinase family protein n=1 Tax=Nonomuraea angiospora TaxID=46172 RepID=UPI0029BAB462|nr:recombinase family protein [Nonomuraea angiospora]MDX3109557.1 recombinase family protein [Nonomuraea angiospora]